MKIEDIENLDGKGLGKLLDMIKSPCPVIYHEIMQRYFDYLAPDESWERDHDEVWDAEARLVEIAKRSKDFKQLISEIEI